MMVAGLAGIGNFRVFERIFRQQGDKHMAVDITGFGALGNSRHVAAHTIGKRMDRVAHVLVDLHMALKALRGTCRKGL